MDINIAIVEDEENIVEDLKKALLIWEEGTRGHADIFTYSFYNGKSFLHDKRQFDIIFLDIELETKELGLKIAQDLRTCGDQTPIVFLTSHKDKMFFGYKVRAVDFLIKPIKQTEINWCMNQIMESLSVKYYVHAGRENLKIAYKNIYYFESRLHYLRIVSCQGEYERIGSLQKLIGQLPPEFVRCHRSYIINLNHVISLRNKKVQMANGESIDVSATYQEEVARLYLKNMP